MTWNPKSTIHRRDQLRWANAKSKAKLSVWVNLCAATSLLITGCHVQPPGGTPIVPRTLGAVVDEANLMQETNAELAKLVIYSHEFEINEQTDRLNNDRARKIESSFQFRPEPRVRGIRLNPYGQDHLRQIAGILMQYDNPNLLVIVERSETSKKWRTKHRYPVHLNDELDEARRQIVVAALAALGVEQADELVVVAPVFTTGLNAGEAAAAYRSTMQNSGTFYNGGSGAGFGNFGGIF